ncbi:MAG TPA: AIR synthase-related protein, partial [Acidimicrobiales bacterium]|nr:AIR synthase-related protein [Acidimicrobiales bacterium]
LELYAAGLVVGIQDLGGAGLACATSETAARGRVGLDVDVSAVPRREPGMEPFEVMTSESQERMLAIVTPEGWDRVAEVCARWEVRATVVGRVVEPVAGPDGEPVGWLRVRDGADGAILAEVPASSLADEAPLYDRPRARPSGLDALIADEPSTDGADARVDLLGLLGDAQWVHRQYDSMLFLNTVVGPGRDAALLRLAGPGLPPSRRGLAITTDSNPAWCALDPRAGTALTLLEAVSNLACVGATAVAVVNCLNFGNPEHPEVMWQLSESVDGLAEACAALGLPVVGGNVSLYNESGGADIDPTPVLGVIGLVDALVARPPGWEWREGDDLVLVGAREAAGDRAHPLGGTRWARSRGYRGGSLPAVDIPTAARAVEFVAEEVAAACAGRESAVSAVHDVAGGGLAVALAELAASAGVGARIPSVRGVDELFSESPGRFLVATSAAVELVARAAALGVDAEVIGSVGGHALVIDGLLDVDVAALAERQSRALPVALGVA